MRIALINPCPSKYPPLGLVTIASYLLEAKHKVSIYDSAYKVPTDVELIGIRGLSIWLKNIRHTLDFLPKHIPVVIGGPCVTANPDVVHSLDVDYGVVGEGEETICEFVEALESNKSTTNIKGLIKHGEPKFTPRPFLGLSKKLVPAWHLLAKLNYKAGLGVETSRGCPFNCVFCNAPLISGRTWRSRTPIQVVREILELYYYYKPKRIYFADDNCTVNPKRWKEICVRLARMQLDIEFHVPEGIQAHHLDFFTLKMMERAGFKRITIGAESGNNRVLKDVIGKGSLTIEQVEKVVKNCVKLGLKISCFFVIGIPGETVDEMEQTLAFARHLRKLGAESCSIRNCLPIPGTRLWREHSENILISEEQAQNHLLLHSEKHFLKTEDWQPYQVEALVKQGQKENEVHIRKNNLFKWALKQLVGTGKI